MFPVFWIWSPQMHYPWSGSVAQQIEPNTNWFFDAISPASGVAAIEKKAFERASYGRQLGLINEVLLDLAEHGGVTSAEAAKSLARLKEIQADIAIIKKEEISRSARAIVADIERLKSQDCDEYERLIKQLGLAGD